MSYRYINADVFPNCNMIDIEGPDGRLSVDDVMLIIAQREWLRRLVFLTIPAGDVTLTTEQDAALRRCEELGAIDEWTGLDHPDDIIDERSIEQRIYDGDALPAREEA